MDVVYVRTHLGQAQGSENKQPQHQNGNGNAQARTISTLKFQPIENVASLRHQQYQHQQQSSRRRWTVSVAINDNEPYYRTIVDPFLETEYKTIFEHYLHDLDRPRWSPESQTLELEDRDTGARLIMEDLIQSYGEQLLIQLNLRSNLFDPKATVCQVFVIDEDGPTGPDPAANAGIHCLAWELLEALQPLRLPKLRVTRISDLPAPALQRRHFPLRLRQSLAAALADPTQTIRVLLVVARDFSRTGSERDPEPFLAQWPLMNLQRKLRNRMILEMVRPGSCEELELHLQTRSSQGIHFHLVHFDLHGRIKADENGVQVPWLLFAKQHRVTYTPGYQVPQTNLAKADAVAHVLARHSVENVVLNACLSAYHRSGPSTNLAHIFLRYGIQNVSAMWYFVHWQTVSTYLDAFYEELLNKGKSFHLAAQLGREAVRQKPTNSRVGRAHQDFFLCVNYSRKMTRVDAMVRDPSPAPSARSQDSSTSNKSGKSFLSGVLKSPTPRLSDALLVGDEPIMKLKLHLLELEYKLTTFRVVYASDLRSEIEPRLDTTIEGMVTMWLNTNMIDEVFYYKAKDFAKRRFLTEAPPYRERRSRATSGGYLQLLFPKPVKALWQKLHIIKDIDHVVDPGYQADANEMRRLEERKKAVEENLQRFAQSLHEDGHSYLLLLGSRDAQWWRTFLHYLEGDWWVHASRNWTVHSRYKSPGYSDSAGGKKPPLGMS